MNRRGDHRLVVACAAVFVVAATLRLTYVGTVLEHAGAPLSLDADVPLASYMTPDTRAYLRPARALADGAVLDAGTLARPPGYPLFLAALRVDPAAVLVAQALAGALLSVLTLLLVSSLSGNLVAAVAAGGLYAILPTGVGLTALMTPDLLLGFAFGVGLLSAVLAARRSDARWLLGAGTAWGAALLLKPVMSLWIPVSLVVLWLLGGRTLRVVPKRALAALVLLQALPMIAWSTRNLAVEGTFTYSMIGLSTARVYWLAKAELMAQGPGDVAPEELEAHQTHLRARLFGDGVAPSKVKDEALTILRRHPEAALRSFGQNVDENTRIGWDRFRVQLRSLPDAAATLEGIARIEGRAFRVVRWLLALVPLIVGILWAAQRPLQDRQLWNDALAMWISAAYFVGLSGLTFWTGPRMIFPAVPPFLAMVALLSTVAWPDRTRAPPDEAGTGRP